MLRKWLLAWLGQQKPEPTPASLGERLDILERHLKRFEGELDEEVEKIRALNARMSKMVAGLEKRPPDRAGPTIDPQGGVTPPPPPQDRWLGLAAHRAAAKGA